MLQCAYCGKELSDMEGIESCKKGSTGEPYCQECKENEEVD